MATILISEIFASVSKTSMVQFAAVILRIEARPLTYADVHADIERLIHVTAMRSQDQTCASLSYEEIKGESFQKVAEVLDKGWLERSKTRAEFFAVLSSAIKNNVCSLIQRYRFTQKRTGVKPPPKEERKAIMRWGTEVATVTQVSTKPMEVSLDDEDAHVQVSNSAAEATRDYDELKEELLNILTATERVVFSQMAEPNVDAMIYAQLDAIMGTKEGTEYPRIKVKDSHMASGIGMPLNEFQKYQETIREKVKKYMSSESDSVKYNTAMAMVKQAFGLQIPPSIDEQVIRRLLSIAARQQYQKVENNEPLKKALNTVGALVPEVTGDKFRCFGIMFQSHHRICNSCGLRDACAAKAANFGLGEITLSHKLLGARNTRVPVITPNSPAESNQAENTRDEEILDFLNQNFKKVIHHGDTYFRHKDRLPNKPGMQLILCIGRSPVPLKLRFVTPLESLQSALSLESAQGVGPRSWYLPETTSAQDAINLIRAHADSTFSVA